MRGCLCGCRCRGTEAVWRSIVTVGVVRNSHDSVMLPINRPWQAAHSSRACSFFLISLKHIHLPGPSLAKPNLQVYHVADLCLSRVCYFMCPWALPPSTNMHIHINITMLKIEFTSRLLLESYYEKLNWCKTSCTYLIENISLYFGLSHVGNISGSFCCSLGSPS